ncbi:hypothetical protein diail_11501 [Diaporthe ilicicola]|nr:hypothetical protein diail_11501 [Diaporthe ilicicola]
MGLPLSNRGRTAVNATTATSPLAEETVKLERWQSVLARLEQRKRHGAEDSLKTANPHPSQPFPQPVQDGKGGSRNSQVPVQIFSPPQASGNISPSGTHPSPAHQDPPDIKPIKLRELDGIVAKSITADGKYPKTKNDTIPVKDAGAAAAAQSTPTGPSHAEDLRQRIRALQSQAEELATRRREAGDKDQEQIAELEKKALCLRTEILRKQTLLRDHEARSSSAHASDESRASGISPDTTQPSLKSPVPLAVDERLPSPRPAAVSLRSMRRQAQDKPASPSAPAPEENSRAEPGEDPENEWTDIELEEAVVPLGQEDWEDDIDTELIPTAATHNPQYPRTRATSIDDLIHLRI